MDAWVYPPIAARIREIPSTYYAVAAIVVALLAAPVFYPQLAPTDAYVYLAAGQRLNAGHELYHLHPGDLVIGSNPPYWNVPTLSPPLLGVIWRPLAALGWNGMLLGWALSGAAYLVAVAFVSWRMRGIALVATMVLSAPIGIQLGLGNVNGLIAFGLVLAWLWRDRPALLGLILAVIVALKVTPVVLLVWLIATGRIRAVIWFVMASGVLLAVSAFGAGVGAVLEYPGIMISTSGTGSTDLSLAGLARSLGVPVDIALFMPWLVLIIGCILMTLTRKDERIGFAVAVCLIVLGSPVVREYWLALLLPALMVFEQPLSGDRSGAA